MEKEDIFMRKVYIMKVVGKIMFDKVTVEWNQEVIIWKENGEIMKYVEKVY
jgi:hypothetical protein